MLFSASRPSKTAQRRLTCFLMEGFLSYAPCSWFLSACSGFIRRVQRRGPSPTRTGESPLTLIYFPGTTTCPESPRPRPLLVDGLADFAVRSEKKNTFDIKLKIQRASGKESLIIPFTYCCPLTSLLEEVNQSLSININVNECTFIVRCYCDWFIQTVRRN